MSAASDEQGPPRRKPGPHILSRFDGDLGHFRSLVLEMGQRVVAQVTTASEALADCDITKARQVIDERPAIRALGGGHACNSVRK